MNKRIIRILTLILLTASLAACGITTNTTAATTSVTTANTTLTTADPITTTVRTTLGLFTLAQLATYNGDNGSTAYIAVNNIVYDVTDVAEWTNGWHIGEHLAGTDATAAFNDSPHSLSFLNQLDIVGVLID